MTPASATSAVLGLLLAAPAPVAPAPAPMTEFSVGTVLAIVSALFTAAFWAVRVLGGRVVQSEDTARDALRQQVASHAAELKLISDGQVQMRADVRQLTTSVDSMRGQLTEFKSTMDVRIEKIGEHYRGQLKELQGSLDKKLDDVEYRLRNDMTRAAADVVRARNKTRT